MSPNQSVQISTRNCDETQDKIDLVISEIIQTAKTKNQEFSEIKNVFKDFGKRLKKSSNNKLSLCIKSETTIYGEVYYSIFIRKRMLPFIWFCSQQAKIATCKNLKIAYPFVFDNETCNNKQQLENALTGLLTSGYTKFVIKSLL